jgi:tetratricopeptide (TPR) repeat protein
LGNAYLAQGRWLEAKAAYAEALRLAPSQARNHYNFGLACYRLGEYADAADALRVAARATLSFVRYNLLAYYFLGRSLEALGQAVPAQTAYQAMARFRKGCEMLTEELRDSPDYPSVVLLRADLADIEQRLK